MDHPVQLDVGCGLLLRLGRGYSDIQQISGRVARIARARSTVMVEFDYSVSAELFPSRHRKHNNRSLRYRRFARAADAIRFAIEELPPELLAGAFLEVDGKRYDDGAIRRLYESSEYRLPRRTVV